MLDANDLRAIAELMDERLTKSEEKISAEMDKRIGQSEKGLFQKISREMDRRITKSENMLLTEMGRDREHLEKQIAEIKAEVERLEQYSRIHKLEEDNSALLLRMIEDLKKEMETLKSKIA